MFFFSFFPFFFLLLYTETKNCKLKRHWVLDDPQKKKLKKKKILKSRKKNDIESSTGAKNWKQLASQEAVDNLGREIDGDGDELAHFSTMWCVS